MIRRHTAALRVALMGVDVASAAALFVLVAGLRVSDRDWTTVMGTTTGLTGLTALAYAGGWVLMLWLRGLYRLRTRWSVRREALDILASAAIMALFTFAVLFLLHLSDVSRLFLLALFPAQVVLTLAVRIALRRGFEWLRRRGGNARFSLVVGTGPAAQEFADRMESHPSLGLKVIGHLSEPHDAPLAVSRPVLGSVEDVIDVLHDNVVDEVAICLTVTEWALVEPVTRVCEAVGRVVRIPMDVVGVHMERGIVEEFDGQPVVSYVYGPDRAVGLLLKRGSDVAIAGLGLLILAPLLVIVGLLIRATDGGPPIFRQTRVGLHGRTFTLLKFRSMVPHAEDQLEDLRHLNEIQGGAFKLTEDPRQTRIGGWLRRTSLDELPQLWNVLRGEMSLVGPRPPLPKEVAGYDLWHRRRLSMKPGVTGLWQIEGRREPLFDRWVAMDLDYIDRWSLWLDLKILLRTIPSVLQQQGR
ncbi:MAG: sugar transferase [Chloroflexi bacterium]|nr:sugar transferase [Chloroflexota bacterium]MDQ3407748.1 sugar transferase [Chloroflexota bacterium]